MPKQHAIGLIILGTLCLLSIHFALAAEYAGPDDENAVRAAEAAANKLGPQQGAIAFSADSTTYTGRSINIVGLEAVSVSGAVSEVERTLQDLGAKKTDTGIEISLSGDVLFDFDKWNVRTEAEDSLFKIAKAVKELGKKKMMIEGHTDGKGSEAYNRKLSERRAQSVRAWFLQKGGLKGVTIQTRGYGESEPVATNTKPDGSDDPEGRAKNRRVEIRIPR